MGLIHKYIDLLEDMAAAFGRTKCGPWSNLAKLVWAHVHLDLLHRLLAFVDLQVA